METRNGRSAVRGILEQFLELGGLTAVALVDGSGTVIASAGESSATGALAAAVARLLRGVPGHEGSNLARLFEDTDEFVARGDAATMGLLLRRVGDDWALAAIWAAEPAGTLRELASETAERLQTVS